MSTLQKIQRKITSFFKRIVNYRGIYIHWLGEDQVEDITELVVSKELERSSSSTDIEY